ncbi:MAG: Ig-like domain-containing protein [Methanobacterium paludis]|nr:Ig-like domain-containing protein [Methanobacterium paludis]
MIASFVKTKNGKTNTIFNSGASTSGTAKITTSLDKQNVQNNITIDKTAPIIVNSDPKNNEIEVPGNKVIKITFSESVKAGTNWIEMMDNNGTMVPITTYICGNTLTITPVVFITNGTRYGLIIHTGSVTDLAGNNVTRYVTHFITDSIAPVIISSDPVKNVMNVPINKIIKVTFNEPIKAGTNWIELIDNSTGAMVPITTSISGKTLTLTPQNLLTDGRKYSVLIHTNSLKDLAGNNIARYVTSFATDGIIGAAERVNTYVETNHRLPSNITISGIQVNMRQFLKLSTKTVLNINNDLTTPIILESVGNAPNPAETMTNGIFNSTEYLNIANRVNSFMNSNGKAPNYATSSLGNMRYESLVYMYSQILSSYNNKNVLPSFIRVNSWSVVSNSNTVFYSVDQVNDAASRVKAYVEVNHRLPNYVTIFGKQVTMAQFLQLSNAELLNINGTLCTSFISRNYGTAPAPSETAKNGNINSTEYLDIANRVNSFMNSNGKAPNYATSSLGNVRYESLIYTNSQILSSYDSFNGTVPDYITVNPWTVVSNLNTVFIGMDQVNSASGTVKFYVETNHQLPDYVTVSGKQVTMPQFLQLLTTTMLNRESNLNTSIVLGSIGNATNSIEDITSGDVQYSEYIDIAKDAKKFL